MSFSKPANKNVSSSGINRQERVIISQLKVIIGPVGQLDDGKNKKRSRSSIVWKYFGRLHLQGMAESNEIDKTRVYCR